MPPSWHTNKAKEKKEIRIIWCFLNKQLMPIVLLKIYEACKYIAVFWLSYKHLDWIITFYNAFLCQCHFSNFLELKQHFLTFSVFITVVFTYKHSSTSWVSPILLCISCNLVVKTNQCKTDFLFFLFWVSTQRCYYFEKKKKLPEKKALYWLC